MSDEVILVVEPNPGILIVARNELTRAGYTVCAVSTIDEGIELVQDQIIDLVLLDAPQASPRLVGALHKVRRVPVILTFQRGQPISGSIDIDETQPGVATAEFLEKPFAQARLLSTVERVLAGRADDLTTSARRDTLVSVPAAMGPAAEEVATGQAEFFDADQTDIFPFAHLLEYRRSEAPPDTSSGSPRDGRAGLLAERLRALLEIEGLVPTPAILSACLRACDAVLESSNEQRTVRPHAEPSPSIEGIIPQLSIDQVLQLAMAVDQPSLCRISQEAASIDLYYEDGNVAFARQVGLPDGFLLGQFLVASGKLREPDLMATLDAGRDGRRLGERLLARASITQTDLSAALRLQTEELVYEVVRWSTGRFAIFARASLPPEAVQWGPPLAVPHLLLEGMRRLDEWRRMRTEVGDLDSVLDRREPSTKSVVAELSAEDREVFRYVDGRRTVAELIRNVSRPTFHVYRALYGLAERRLIGKRSA